MGIFDVGSGVDELEYDVVVQLFSSAYNACGEGFCGGELKHLVDAVPVIEAHCPGAPRHLVHAGGYLASSVWLPGGGDCPPGYAFGLGEGPGGGGGRHVMYDGDEIRHVKGAVSEWQHGGFALHGVAGGMSLLSRSQCTT